MSRLASACFAWLIVLSLVLLPVASVGASVASAQAATDATPGSHVPETTDTPADQPVVTTDTATPDVTATVEEPSATDTETAGDPSATATESETAAPGETATGTENATATDVATDEPTIVATDVPTETPVATDTPKPTITPKATKTPAEDSTFSTAQVTDLVITVSCRSDPETIRVTNVGAANITLTGIATYSDPSADEPFSINRVLKPGNTAIYQSGHAAQYGTVLTTHYIFTDSDYDAEGVSIATSAGTAVKMCDPRPAPPAGQLSDLKVTLDCLANAETIRVSNNGTGWITIKGFATYIDPIADEPIATNRVLKPGQTGIFQAGAGAKYGTVLTNQFIFTNSAYEKDGIRIATSVGKVFKACPAKPLPPEHWIEVNLSWQYLIAWEGNTKVNETYVSTGRPGFDTPTGTFYVLYRYRYQTMAGCLQGECYNIPDVPWVQYFTNYGHALHGAYWHNNFGYVMSHGCVNLPLWFAAWLWDWATYGTRVVIHY
jgi:hypothetical protein